MSQIPVNKNVFGRDFTKVIDTEFRQLLGKVQEEQREVTVEEFFQLYEDLFFQIPKEGDANSHRFILKKEADYLGVKLTDEIDVDALLQEITLLRQELLDANKTISGIKEL